MLPDASKVLSSEACVDAFDASTAERVKSLKEHHARALRSLDVMRSKEQAVLRKLQEYRVSIQRYQTEADEAHAELQAIQMCKWVLGHPCCGICMSNPAAYVCSRLFSCLISFLLSVMR